eukprot:scaffold17348_cov84-Isochrysis_galbana.AAC.2
MRRAGPVPHAGGCDSAWLESTSQATGGMCGSCGVCGSRELSGSCESGGGRGATPPRRMLPSICGAGYFCNGHGWEDQGSFFRRGERGRAGLGLSRVERGGGPVRANAHPLRYLRASVGVTNPQVVGNEEFLISMTQRHHPPGEQRGALG